MPIRTLEITPEQKKALVQLCREYADLQKKAVEIRWALNDQVAALAGLVQRDEVAGLSIDFTQIEVVSVEEWKEELLNVTTSGRWVCTGFPPTEAGGKQQLVRNVEDVLPQGMDNASLQLGIHQRFP